MCAVENGMDVVRLARGRFAIEGIIGLAPRDKTDAISGLTDVGPYCRETGLRHITVETYNLSKESDKRALLDAEIDVLLVVGWQRLIPEWLIEHCAVAAIGVHGSAGGITGGRGRSPQNWALMLGCPSFEVSTFFVDPGVDSGDVLDSRQFDLAPDDDIRMSHLKVSAATVDMIEAGLASGAISERRGTPQPTEGIRYMPQRRPEDGAIDWRLSARDLVNFVRALTRPYPGAACGSLRVWRARALLGDFPGSHGTVLAHLAGGELVVRAGEAAVLLDDWEAPKVPAIGSALPCADAAEQMRGIIARHTEKHPELPISEDVLRYAHRLGADRL
ncbi:MAG: formyltransferase family protein [Planctomycetota bacterium]